jgi:hypothetical protein
VNESLPPPRTYAEWVRLLDRFREGYDDVLGPMRDGAIEWTPVVAERWSAQLSDAMTVRLQQLSKRLQRALDRAGGESFGVANSLLDARRSLASVQCLATLPCLEGRVRLHLTSELTRWARETQDSLEKGAQQVRWDGGRLLKALRDNPLTAPINGNATGPQPASTLDHSPKPRRIIL